ncbi:hypothetical protein HYQ45_004591 [Verticillium longisporum]|uniref:Uncharacterized protein n=1 Tax=Verticillium longisporum TaxID=100787 RepID=A0A8I2ZUY0_VERLO|nr:hypothetical protein HYQ45_004591 [Verticillium longisporum]
MVLIVSQQATAAESDSLPRAHRQHTTDHDTPLLLHTPTLCYSGKLLYAYSSQAKGQIRWTIQSICLRQTAAFSLMLFAGFILCPKKKAKECCFSSS